MIITILTFIVIALAAIDQFKENAKHLRNKSRITNSTKINKEKNALSQISYQLQYLAKKKIKYGMVIEDKIEAQEFLEVWP